MRVTRHPFAAALLLPFLACSADRATAPDTVSMGDAAVTSAVVDVTNSNVWELWPVNLPGSCLGRPVTGWVPVHIQTHYRETQQGTYVVQHLVGIPAGATLTDGAGTEYVLRQRSHFRQTDTGGSNIAWAEADFQLVSKGWAPNEVLNITLRIEWDGQSLKVTSATVTACRGA